MPHIGPASIDSYAPVDLHGIVAEAIKLLADPTELTVIVNDPQRQTNSRAVLDVLTKHIPADRIRILVATGSHTFSRQEQADFEAALADVGLQEILWHESESENLVDIAQHWRGNPWLLEDRPLLAIGSIEPHYFAGFTGAHKTFTIGCASFEDIQANHANAIKDQCRPCRLEENPIHENVTKMLGSLAGLQKIVAINLVQKGDRIVAAAAGQPLEALLKLLPTACEMFTRSIPGPADAIVAEVTGPLGKSLYQADKGIKNSEWAVRDGGTIVLVAGCEDGIGQDDFVKTLKKAQNYDKSVGLLDTCGYHLGDHKAVRLRYLTDPKYRNISVYVVSEGLSSADLAGTGLLKAGSIEEAFKDAHLDPKSDKIYHVEDAGNFCILGA